MIKSRIAGLLVGAIARAQEQGKLPPVALPDIVIEHPQNQRHGDYASSLPLKLARAIGVSPMTIAGDIAGLISATPEIERVEVAPPGFINFTLNDRWLASQVDLVLESGQSYGNADIGQGSRVQIEFVSVNPTGPLHVGHGRGGILGSTLANVLSSAGYRTEKEYYINDAGAQIEAFRRSLYARYQQCRGIEAEVPAGGYFGAYMIDLAKEILAGSRDRLEGLTEPELLSELGRIGLEKMIAEIKDDLGKVGVTFDSWFSEQGLFQEGEYAEAMSLLKQGGYVAEREGATWFTSTALGEDKDNVMVRSDGSPTYFASDIAYHYNKFVKRGFDQVINIWGADHMGHVSRMKAVVSALGIDPERLTIIIAQMVTLRRGGEVVRISKRTGDIITLRELVDEVGADACRFFFLSRTADSQMDFDMELAKKQSADNPVYYVQYAHARIASILRLAGERGINFEDGDVSLLTSEPELSLIRQMLLLPEIIETIARTLEPHLLTYYAQDLATVFHAFYRDCRVVSDDEALTRARLKLVKAARTVLSRTLNLMGMTAPDRM
ncbi:MAG: arginine--tRNA ligase [Chloroflexi bacterium]|nr:arginine--tRNA ligase [Chloroflexota bacterium]